MRFYGTHSGKNNMSRLLARSYMFNSNKNKNKYNNDNDRNTNRDENDWCLIISFIVIFVSFVVFFM